MLASDHMTMGESRQEGETLLTQAASCAYGFPSCPRHRLSVAQQAMHAACSA